MSRIGGASNYVLVIHNTDGLGGGGVRTSLGVDPKEVGDPLIPGVVHLKGWRTGKSELNWGESK